jgi:hypothetical protein
MVREHVVRPFPSFLSAKTFESSRRMGRILRLAMTFPADELELFFRTQSVDLLQELSSRLFDSGAPMRDEWTDIACFQRSCARRFRFDATLPPGLPWPEFEEFWEVYARWIAGEIEIEFDQLWAVILAIWENRNDILRHNHLPPLSNVAGRCTM